MNSSDFDHFPELDVFRRCVRLFPPVPVNYPLLNQLFPRKAISELSERLCFDSLSDTRFIWDLHEWRESGRRRVFLESSSMPLPNEVVLGEVSIVPRQSLCAAGCAEAAAVSITASYARRRPSAARERTRTLIPTHLLIMGIARHTSPLCSPGATHSNSGSALASFFAKCPAGACTDS